MSEVSGPSTVTPPDVLRSGSIGLPIPGMQLKIDNPDEKGNGEVYSHLFSCRGNNSS